MYKLTVIVLFGFLSSLNLNAEKFKVYDQKCEEALALSALPLHLRSKANVHVLQDNKFVKTVLSNGDYHCMLGRNHPHALIPQCVTASGVDSILPGLFFKTLKTLEGKSTSEVDELFNEAIEKNILKVPNKPGINYMMSDFNHIYVAHRKEFRDVPAHVMVFAQDISNEEIGGSFQLAMENKGYPFVVDSGPHGYIISMVEKASDSKQVLKACHGQL